MNILVIDTATEGCSVALSVNSGTEQEEIAELFEFCPQQHSQRLLPMVEQLLSQAQMSLKDFNLLAFGRGPGSFTGVRIATGMVQGLALGAGLPVVGISTLAAMAQQALMDNNQECIATAIDARMGEIYLGCYQASEGIAQLHHQERVLPPAEAIELLKDDSKRWCGVGTGWSAYPELAELQNVHPDNDILYPKARYMLPLAQAAFSRGEAVAADKAQPVYLRDKVTWKKLPGR
ncbi:tRNA (adenosine(37)-N6)-threonylcarbamoyltransferase complex dimerization subunit type 1 TsaB [Lacimicrobium alkaliphilum]|uniref:tRNA threonylcarbamoyladenosine biosynthesis protein TsaB n=1 Tax=Lacimicrobium alkaliphilum TaxID=1526571 RepID=A0ABQ1RE73_9ALTE|nr:tRNA (adenosine(37)-N6)-threonylcarbamoyltransferase complex dimerization subunit type 1 TsaB [Lacimicrobium alkaliphilum]GGD63772.1 tRNA (adenosine(37)-N6)-threonylcarbamoyltransferase complex dimerization subunit type 1 TsaB [Lacimicrobium alkaliphilum]